MRLLARLGAAFLLAVVGFGAHGEAVILESADFVMSESLAPPPDSAAWRPLQLPDNWNVSRQGTAGLGWYRIALPKIEERRLVNVVHVGRISAEHIAFFVNGAAVGGTSAYNDLQVRLFQQPITFNVPRRLLRDEGDVLHVRVRASGEFNQGLTRIVYGDGVAVGVMQRIRYRVQVLSYALVGFAVLVGGLFSLAIWLRRRDDPAFFWFSVAAILLGAPATIIHAYGFEPSGPLRDVLNPLFMFAYAPALTSAALRFAGLRVRWLEIGLWGLLAAASVAPVFAGEGIFPRLFGPLQMMFLTALTAAAIVLAFKFAERNRVLASMIVIAIAVAVGFGIHDWFGWMGWLDFNRPSLSQFAPPVFAVALGALLVNRHLETVAEVQQFSRELEARVAQRTAEVERTYEQLRGLEREQATVRERQRIMSDMHDGLGAALVSLLSVVQSGKADSKEVEQRVHHALQELRLAIDSMDMPEGDLVTALGTVRHRLRDPLDAAGIEFEWRVEDIPKIDGLTPSRILSVQRIVLEAITNAVRHAQATKISLSLRSEPAEGRVALVVADNGHGFLATTTQNRGYGLMNMQRRAAALGSRLGIFSSETGTRIQLQLAVDQ